MTHTPSLPRLTAASAAFLFVLFSGTLLSNGQDLTTEYGYRARGSTAGREQALTDRYSTLNEDLKILNSHLDTPPIKRSKEKGGVFRLFDNPPDINAVDGVLETRLTIDYAFNSIWNPAQQGNVTVHLRSYNGGLVGPTLRVTPGDHLSVLMDNQLEHVTPHHGPINAPHNFNTTNLHTHGLHVSPSGNSDNIFVHIGPSHSFHNEIYVPSDHPTGTFWYHGHVHGSTAIQVSSGMAGALIVEGGLDAIEEIADAAEYVMIFQQIPYRQNTTRKYYEIETYDDFGPGSWDANASTTGWRTIISGQTFPVIKARPKEVMRLRMIHSGVREGIEPAVIPYERAAEIISQQIPVNKDLQTEREMIRKIADPEMRRTRQQDLDTRIAQSVQAARRKFQADAVPLHEIAADGLAYGYTWTRPSIPLFPGYRSDALLKCSDPGLYVIIDLEVDAKDALHGTYEAPKLLGAVYVSGTPLDMSLPSDSSLTALRPHEPITDSELDPAALQKVEFNIDLDFDPLRYEINSQPFDPDRKPRTLTLNTASEWILTSRFVAHPFHIHVNPFQITSIQDEDGNEQLPLDEEGEPLSIWKDTILVREGYTIRARSRYERYIGAFVLHCHILDHEDRGMMEAVEIVLPGKHHRQQVE